MENPSDGDNKRVETGSDQVQKCDICNENFSDGYCNDCEAYMCQTCFDRHLKTRPCRHHVLAEDTEHQTEERTAEPCKIHENQIIEFFCVEHRNVGCAKCMLSNHSTCRREDIDVAANRFNENGEEARLSATIRNVETMYTDCIERVQQLTQNVAAANDKTVNEIEAFQASISLSVDETVRVALEKAEHLRLENENQIERFSAFLGEIRNSLGLIKDSLKSKDELEKLFIAAIEMEPKLAQYEERLSTLKTENVSASYHFHPHRIILDMISDTRLFGEVRQETEELDNYVGKLEQMEMKYNDECAKTQSLEQQLRERDEQIKMLTVRLSEVKLPHQADTSISKMIIPNQTGSSKMGISKQANSSDIGIPKQTHSSKMGIPKQAYSSIMGISKEPESIKIVIPKQDVSSRMDVPIQADVSKIGIFMTQGIKVMVYKASILRLNVDCIVSASNSNLQNGGGVARVISLGAGETLEHECKAYIRTNRRLPVGEACTTTAGNLHYKCVIHAVGPTWYDYKRTVERRKELEDVLMMSVYNSFYQAERNGMTSIALPAISSAIFGVPINICTTQYVRATQKYFSQKKKDVDSTLSEIHFIDVKEDTVCAIQNAFIKARGTVCFEDK